MLDSASAVTTAPFGRLAIMEHTNEDIDSLGAKLDSLDLTDGERAILDTLIAGDDDVAGHGDLGFGMKIGTVLNTSKPYFDGAGSHIANDPISGGDLGSSRISGTDLGSGR